jgi:outer membrane protein TolC
MQAFNKHFLLLIASLFIAASALAQEQTIELNLQTVLELGKANNLTIKLYQEQQKLAAADLVKAREWWLPDLNVGARTHYLSGSAMNGDGAFFTDVNRNNLWLGLGLDASWDIGNEVFKSKSAKLLSEASQYRTAQVQNETLLASIEAYFDLLLSEVQTATYQQLILQSDTIINQLNAQVEGGLRYESELLLAKSARGQLQVNLLGAQIERTEFASQLIEQLSLTTEVELELSEQMLAPINLVKDESTDLQMEQVYEKQPILKMYDLRKKAIETERKTYGLGVLLPRIDIQVYGSMFGGYSSVLLPTGETNAAIGWNIPLSMITGGDMKRSRSMGVISDIERQAAQQQISAMVYRTNARVAQMNVRLEMSSEAQQYATKALGQSVAREKLGTARPFEVFEAQKVYMQARMQYLKSIVDFNKEQYRLYVSLGNVL